MCARLLLHMRVAAKTDFCPEVLRKNKKGVKVKTEGKKQGVGGRFVKVFITLQLFSLHLVAVKAQTLVFNWDFNQKTNTK